MRKVVFAVAFCLPLMGFMGCSSPPQGDTPAPPDSPREVAATILDSYAIMQSIANAALESNKLPPADENKIVMATEVATAAVLKLSGAAKLCLRIVAGKDDQGNPIYVVVDEPKNPPGQHCDASTIGQLKGSAISLIGDAKKLLSLFGFN